MDYVMIHTGKGSGLSIYSEQKYANLVSLKPGNSHENLGNFGTSVKSDNLAEVLRDISFVPVDEEQEFLVTLFNDRIINGFLGVKLYSPIIEKLPSLIQSQAYIAQFAHIISELPDFEGYWILGTEKKFKQFFDHNEILSEEFEGLLRLIKERKPINYDIFF